MYSLVFLKIEALKHYKYGTYDRNHRVYEKSASYIISFCTSLGVPDRESNPGPAEHTSAGRMYLQLQFNLTVKCDDTLKIVVRNFDLPYFLNNIKIAGVKKKIMKVIQDGTSTFGTLLVSTWILESPKKRLLWVFLFMVVDLSSTTQKKLAFTVEPMLAFLR